MNIAWLAGWSVIAQVSQEPARGSFKLLMAQLLAAVVFSVIGIVVFFTSLWLMEKLTPFSIIKEIIDEHNEAVATIIGGIVLGISIIIAAAILG